MGVSGYPGVPNGGAAVSLRRSTKSPAVVRPRKSTVANMK